jgi:hypothetical protein
MNQMAQEAPGQTLSPTALVHEAWLTLAAKPVEPQGVVTAAIRGWHRQAQIQALKRQEGYAARFHPDRLLELAPRNDSLAALLDTVDVFPAFTNKVGSHARLNPGRAMMFHQPLWGAIPVVLRCLWNPRRRLL